MIKKLFSKALLSVVMDKSARDRLETLKHAKPAAPPAPAGGDADDAVAEETEASARRRRERERRSLLESLQDADRALDEKPALTPERQALLRQVQAVQQAKAGVFDGLTREQREKLYVVAMKTLNVEPEKPSSKPGPTPGPKPGPKRPTKSRKGKKAR